MTGLNAARHRVTNWTLNKNASNDHGHPALAFAVDPRFYQPYRDAGLDHTESMYAAMVEGMDKSLGDILANVERHGLSDRTIVLFMSDNGGLSAPSSAIRLGDWKLIYYHEDRRCELFNLAQDLGEQTNLADKQPDTRDWLAAELGRYLAAVKAQMPVVKSTGEAVPYPDACERRGGGN